MLETRIYKVTIDKKGLKPHSCPLGGDDDTYNGLLYALGPKCAAPNDPAFGQMIHPICNDYGDKCEVLLIVEGDYPVDTAPRGRLLEIVELDDESGPKFLDEHEAYIQRKINQAIAADAENIRFKVNGRVVNIPPYREDFSNN